MKLSHGEKLIIKMLAEVQQHLGVESDLDADFISDAIHSGNTWAIENRYSGLFHGSDASDDLVRQVHDVLTMWRVIEGSVAKLSKADQDRIAAEVGPLGEDPKWRGFDGNNESEHMSVASFMIKRMGFYEEFSDRGDFNAHMPTLDTYHRMKPAFDAVWGEASWRGNLTADELIGILKERIHPSNRAAS